MWLQAGGYACPGEGPAPCIHHHVVTSHDRVPQSTVDRGVGTPCRHSAAAHARNVSILAREQIFTEAEQCVCAELDSREPSARPTPEPQRSFSSVPCIKRAAARSWDAYPATSALSVANSVLSTIMTIGM